jgi:hypothetical protein
MENFNKLIQEQFQRMCETGKLFRSSFSGNEVWNRYISSFEPQYNPIFRDPESSLHNCNLCKNFIRRYGNIIALDNNNNIMTIFDIDAPDEYKKVIKILSETLKQRNINNVFVETFEELNSLPYEKCNKNNKMFQLGVDKNVKRYTKEEAEKFGVVKPDEIRTFHHLHLFIPKSFIDFTGSSSESIMAEYRDKKNVFKRTMEEISLDTLLLVKDLINQNSLLDGKTHLHKLDAIIKAKKQYYQLKKNQDNFFWSFSYDFQYAKFKNELLGVLCSELSQGEELNKACQNWNKRIDPINYMKAIAPITKKQIEEAKQFVEENGYEKSFDRRFATIDDIKVSEIHHINNETEEIKSISIFDTVKSNKHSQHKRSEFKNIEEIHIETFMKDILPTCSSVEAYVTSEHEKNFMSLTTSNIKNSKPIFKWPNNYSWTYNGNLAGKSQIKEAVKTAGGNIDGILRFSITWNYDTTDNSDLDAWCKQPDGINIGYSSPYRKDRMNIFTKLKGQLDLDIVQPNGKLAVENIYFIDKKHLINGKYLFWVNQFAARNSKGFKAEIECDGQIYFYQYDNALSTNEKIHVASINYNNGIFQVNHVLPETYHLKEIYNLQTEVFHKINLICLSPNYWDKHSIGNKHYFFIIDKCKSENSIRSFHAENLIPELAKHRKVLEILGNTTMIESTDKQLSGLGFNATVKDHLIVRLKGSHKRIIKINF